MIRNVSDKRSSLQRAVFSMAFPVEADSSERKDRSFWLMACIIFMRLSVMKFRGISKIMALHGGEDSDLPGMYCLLKSLLSTKNGQV